MPRTSSISARRRSMLLSGEALGPQRRKELRPGRAAPAKAGARCAGGKPNGPMKPLTDEQFKRVVKYVAGAYNPPEAALLKVALGFCAGARACEMARLRMSDVTDADGNVSDVI